MIIASYRRFGTAFESESQSLLAYWAQSDRLKVFVNCELLELKGVTVGFIPLAFLFPFLPDTVPVGTVESHNL